MKRLLLRASAMTAMMIAVMILNTNAHADTNAATKNAAVTQADSTMITASEDVAKKINYATVKATDATANTAPERPVEPAAANATTMKAAKTAARIVIHRHGLLLLC